MTTAKGVVDYQTMTRRAQFRTLHLYQRFLCTVKTNPRYATDFAYQIGIGGRVVQPMQIAQVEAPTGYENCIPCPGAQIAYNKHYNTRQPNDTHGNRMIRKHTENNQEKPIATE